jgi:pimeloyl-ACP methyl ester carboxylesterase
MPNIRINNLDHYYEQTGEGSALVFIHGAFADSRLWEPQWKYFSSHHRLLRYDLRGHGRTGVSELSHYSMATFADDLAMLLDKLEIDNPIICGLSWGGSIIQVFATRHPKRPRALVLASSAVAIDLTFKDKLLCNVLVPWRLMTLIIRTMNVRNFTAFSLWLARLTQGKHWLSRDENARKYMQQCMFQMESHEYLKIWEAIYGFHLHPLEKISCPTLVLNGEFESHNTFQHSKEILRRIPQAEARIIPGTHHAMSLEEPQVFNKMVEEFLQNSG